LFDNLPSALGFGKAGLEDLPEPRSPLPGPPPEPAAPPGGGMGGGGGGVVPDDRILGRWT